MVGISSAHTSDELESQQGGMWTEYYKGVTKGDYYMIYNPTYNIWQEPEPTDVLGIACSSWTFNTTTGDLILDSSNNKVHITANAEVDGTLNVDSGTQSTTKDTGALILTSGGLGVEGNINAGGVINAGVNINAGGDVNISGMTTTGALVVTHGDWNSIRAINTNGNTYGAYIDLCHHSASPADGDEAGEIRFLANDSAGSETLFGQMRVVCNDVTSGAEDGQFEFFTRNNDTLTEVLRITHAGNVTVKTDDVTFGGSGKLRI